LYVSRDVANLVEALMPHASGAAVLWDFDGVVAHSEPIHEQSYAVLARKRSHKLADTYFAPLVGHTERWIWHRLIEAGFPAEPGEIGALMAERSRIVAALAQERLEPSWIASALMPVFAAVARSQTIVSNGDPVLIESLLEQWNLSTHVTVGRRAAATDKDELFRSQCTLPALVLEDSDTFVSLARDLGAFTVGVRHSHNKAAALPADLLAAL
jgi:phosphoglycolate phosphatase-like HAD superfamily hydrolase